MVETRFEVGLPTTEIGWIRYSTMSVAAKETSAIGSGTEEYTTDTVDGGKQKQVFEVMKTDRAGSPRAAPHRMSSSCCFWISALAASDTICT